jgi:hypothetical protein
MSSRARRRATGSIARSSCLGAATVLLAGVQACGDPRGTSGPRNGHTTPPGSDAGDFTVQDASGPPEPDAGGFCGNQVHQLITNAPNVYFVLDASGSMSTPVSARSTRYDRVRDAAIGLVRDLGPLINVGAAVFPLDATEAEPCRTGAEVFPVTPGSPTIGDDTDGDTTVRFRAATDLLPIGGTPTAATLTRLRQPLSELPGKTIVLLATDGGPNCNVSARCDADECIDNIEGRCDAGVNCCAPSGNPGPGDCIDRSTTVAAIAALAALGVDVYVIGIPGSETYGDVLDEMALAGGAPQFVSPFYYKVDNLDTLGGVLAKIASVVVSCDFDLVDPPPEQGETNVYEDSALVPYDAVDGWIWKTHSVVELRGDACQRLKSGHVKQVQIVSGCPTEVAK